MKRFILLSLTLLGLFTASIYFYRDSLCGIYIERYCRTWCSHLARGSCHVENWQRHGNILELQAISLQLDDAVLEAEKAIIKGKAVLWPPHISVDIVVEGLRSRDLVPPVKALMQAIVNERVVGWLRIHRWSLADVALSLPIGEGAWRGNLSVDRDVGIVESEFKGACGSGEVALSAFWSQKEGSGRWNCRWNDAPVHILQAWLKRWLTFGKAWECQGTSTGQLEGHCSLIHDKVICKAITGNMEILNTSLISKGKVIELGKIASQLEATNDANRWNLVGALDIEKDERIEHFDYSCAMLCSEKDLANALMEGNEGIWWGEDAETRSFQGVIKSTNCRLEHIWELVAANSHLSAKGETKLTAELDTFGATVLLVPLSSWNFSDTRRPLHIESGLESAFQLWWDGSKERQLALLQVRKGKGSWEGYFFDTITADAELLADSISVRKLKMQMGNMTLAAAALLTEDVAILYPHRLEGEFSAFLPNSQVHNIKRLRCDITFDKGDSLWMLGKQKRLFLRGFLEKGECYVAERGFCNIEGSFILDFDKDVKKLCIEKGAIRGQKGGICLKEPLYWQADDSGEWNSSEVAVLITDDIGQRCEASASGHCNKNGKGEFSLALRCKDPFELSFGGTTNAIDNALLRGDSTGIFMEAEFTPKNSDWRCHLCEQPDGFFHSHYTRMIGDGDVEVVWKMTAGGVPMITRIVGNVEGASCNLSRPSDAKAILDLDGHLEWRQNLWPTPLTAFQTPLKRDIVYNGRWCKKGNEVIFKGDFLCEDLSLSGHGEVFYDICSQKAILQKGHFLGPWGSCSCKKAFLAWKNERCHFYTEVLACTLPDSLPLSCASVTFDWLEGEDNVLKALSGSGRAIINPPLPGKAWPQLGVLLQPATGKVDFTLENGLVTVVALQDMSSRGKKAKYLLWEEAGPSTIDLVSGDVALHLKVKCMHSWLHRGQWWHLSIKGPWNNPECVWQKQLSKLGLKQKAKD